jgi:hypothetical protein
MKRAMLVLAVLAVLVGALGATPVSAGYIQSDILTIYRPNGSIDVQVGVTEAGALLGFVGPQLTPDPNVVGCIGQTCGTAEDPGNTYYVRLGGVADPAQFGNFTIVLEPGTDAVSDIFGVANIGTSAEPIYVLGFMSDGDPGGVLFINSPLTCLENGQPCDATIYLSTALKAEGYTATFLSADIHVPLPGTLMLLAFGLAGLGLGFIRREKA